jgi:uncharacterized integral membrane protein
VRPRRKLDKDALETWQPKLWAILGALILLVAYLVAFVTKNNSEVDVDFVLVSAQVSLIWGILLTLAIGVLVGLLVSQAYGRRAPRPGPRDQARPPEPPPG